MTLQEANRMIYKMSLWMGATGMVGTLLCALVGYFVFSNNDPPWLRLVGTACYVLLWAGIFGIFFSKRNGESS